MAAEKIYLGDSVYAQLDDYGATILTTEDGSCVKQKIVLEPEVMNNLLSYATQAGIREPMENE